MKLPLLFCFIIGCSQLFSQSTMEWAYLAGGTTTGSGTCISASNCDNDLLCYGLQYTPTNSGTITSYTTAFFVDCTANNNGNGNPIETNDSCIMSDASDAIVDCNGSGVVLFNSSGNTGVTTVTAGTPVFLHQICLDLSDGQSVDIAEDDFTDLTVSIDRAGGAGPVDEFPNYSTLTVSYNSICNLLAVDLNHFEATIKDETSLLHWITATETNNDYFSIEWSTDGQVFQEISKVQGAGDSQTPKSYHFIHQQPAVGTNYYRLKAIEFDGDAEYSDIRLVQFGAESGELLVFPNPVQNQLSLRFAAGHPNDRYSLELRSVTGQRVLRIEDTTAEALQTIELETLPAGTYVVLVESGRKRLVERFIKQK